MNATTQGVKTDRKPYHIEQLGTVFSHPDNKLIRKIVVVPSAQTGHEILMALSASGTAWLNARAMTVKALAGDILERTGSLRRESYFAGAATRFLVAAQMDSLAIPGDDPFRRSSAHIAGTIQDLRLAGISPERFAEISSSDYRTAVVDIYSAYLAFLSEHGLMDDASILEKARTAILAGEFSSSPFVLCIIGDVRLSELESGVVSALTQRAQRVHLIRNHALAGEEPRLSAASRFIGFVPDETSNPSSSPTGEGAPISAPSGGIQFFRAAGPENEVRGIFQRIVDDRIKLDDVEIAYPVYDPYVRIIRSLAHRYGFDVTFAAGIPVSATRSGQALKAFLEWVRDGYPVDGLIEILRGRLIDLSMDEEEISANTLVSGYLESVRVGGNTRAYTARIERHIEAERSSRDRRRNSNWTVGDLKRVRRYLVPFLKLADRDRMSSPASLFQTIHDFLDRYVRIGPEETEDGLERVTQRELTSRLSRIGTTLRVSVSGSELVHLTLSYLSGVFVQARIHEPGKIHVVPLTSASFSGRSNLFVAGLDEQSFGRQPKDDPLFPDSDKLTVEAGNGTRLGKCSDVLASGSWNLSSAIGRTTGCVVLSYSHYDPVEGQEKFPCAAMLRLINFSECNPHSLPTTSFSMSTPSTRSWTPLDETDVFLSARKDAQARTSIDLLYPHLKRGRMTEIARAGKEWTEYDGLVSGSGLDPLESGAILSASSLETFFSCPFKFFLTYVLHVSPTERKDDHVWIGPMERGRIVHEGLQLFVSSRWDSDVSGVSDHDIDRLNGIFDSLLEDFQESDPAPHPAEYGRQKHYFRLVSRIVVADEIRRQSRLRPVAVEYSLASAESDSPGSSEHVEIAGLHLDSGPLRLRGRIDRVDEDSAGQISITDYKTGNGKQYDESDLLMDGKNLQWVLYACAAEALFGRKVVESGYLFLGEQAFGRRVCADPDVIRSDLENLLESGRALSESSAFIQSGALSGQCQFCEYTGVCGDVSALKHSLRNKLSSMNQESPLYAGLSMWPDTLKQIGESQ